MAGGTAGARVVRIGLLMGTVRKRPELRQRRNKTAELVRRIDNESLPIPAPPKKLLPSTKRRWQEFWKDSDLASYVQPTDMPSLTRLFVLYDEWQRAHQDVTTEPKEPVRRVGETNAMFAVRVSIYQRQLAHTGRLVRGAQGQPMLNPLLRYIHELEGDIRALEDRFGFNLNARQKMGLDMLRARNLSQKTKLIAIGSEDDEPDPVAALQQPGANKRRETSTDLR